MDRRAIKKIAHQYGLVVKQFIPKSEVILFGSYAKGTATADSDIDIAVVVQRNPQEFLTTHQLLFKLRRDIDARIEPVLISAKNDPAGFLDEIRKTGIIVA